MSVLKFYPVYTHAIPRVEVPSLQSQCFISPVGGEKHYIGLKGTSPGMHMGMFINL